MRKILHIDMDAFFAAVEQRRNPDLTGKPLVIGGSGAPARRGVVSTASYEARKFGIHSAMPLSTAYKLCPHAIFLPVDYREYSRVSGKIKDVLREFCPLMQDVGIDEASRGIDESPLVTHWEPKSSRREITFEHDVSNWQVIARTLAELTREVANDMKRAGYKGRTVTVKVRFCDFETHTRAKTLTVPTNTADETRTAAFDCLKRFELKKKVRLIGVKMGGLEKV